MNKRYENTTIHQPGQAWMLPFKRKKPCRKLLHIRPSGFIASPFEKICPSVLLGHYPPTPATSAPLCNQRGLFQVPSYVQGFPDGGHKGFWSKWAERPKQPMDAKVMQSYKVSDVIFPFAYSPTLFTYYVILHLSYLLCNFNSSQATWVASPQ